MLPALAYSQSLRTAGEVDATRIVLSVKQAPEALPISYASQVRTAHSRMRSILVFRPPRVEDVELIVVNNRYQPKVALEMPST